MTMTDVMEDDTGKGAESEKGTGPLFEFALRGL